ncbi:MAG TPA: hypothetical protein VF871_01340 [Burkholderiales bacterium]
MGNVRVVLIAVITIGLFTFASAQAANGPTITSQELDRVYTAIKQNNWKLVEKEILPLIKRPSHAQRYLIARLRYIYLFSLSIQLESKTLKYVDLKKKLAVLENRLIVQPWHPVNANADPCFNQICADKDKPSVLVTAQADNKATQIYSFEYFDMGSPVDISSFKGENARLGGILEKIEINDNLPKAEKANSGVTWFFRLLVKDGFIDYER